MAEATPFVPGLELAETFYHEVVRGILDAEQPGLVYSAGLIGWGSDVLGVDSERSRDHDWGPRGTLFLAAEDRPSRAEKVRRALRAELPATFRGYSVHFSEPDPVDNDIRKMAPGKQGEIDSMVVVSTLEDLLAQILGRRRAAQPDLFDWLTFPEQALLELTSGGIFHDGLGTLGPMRERFAYFPDDVWLHRLSCQWQRIAQEEGFAGRCAEVGDDLGSRIVTARRALPSRLPAVDQLTDLAGAIRSPIRTGRMRRSYFARSE